LRNYKKYAILWIAKIFNIHYSPVYSLNQNTFVLCIDARLSDDRIKYTWKSCKKSFTLDCI